MTARVIVIGGGNAGLCASIAARQHGAEVQLIEAADRGRRGGNSSLTRNIRFPYSDIEDLLHLIDTPKGDHRRILEMRARPSYSEADMLSDWRRVAGNRTNDQLVESIVGRARSCIRWLYGIGHRWEVYENPLPGALQLHLDGGGKRFVDKGYRVAEAVGVQIAYGVRAVDLASSPDGWRVRLSGSGGVLDADSVVLTTGGYQASQELRISRLGPQWADVRLRGTIENDGEVMQLAAARGAAVTGLGSGCHASPISSEAPHSRLPGDMERAHEDTRYAYPQGVMVNARGERFLDETGDFGNMTYASVGAQILAQPGRLAYQIFDLEARKSELPASYHHAAECRRYSSVAAMCDEVGVELDAACRSLKKLGRDLDASSRGLSLLVAPVVCGLTFTFGGVRVTESAHVQSEWGTPLPRLYAAGEIVGGLFAANYPGGSGLLAGAVLGRAAGVAAASVV